MDHPGGPDGDHGDIPMCGDVPCPPPGEPMCFDPARGEIPCSEMSGAGDSGPPPSSEHPPGEHHDSQGQTGDHGGIAMCGDVPCSSGEHGEHHEKDCSEIPEPAGRALCEKTTAEGRSPTMAECMTMPTEEGQANCKEHVQ